MKLVKPPFIISKGIALLVLNKTSIDKLRNNKNTRVRIYYSKKDPVISMFTCDSSQLIWEKNYSSNKALTFIYQSNLKVGFYTILIEEFKFDKRLFSVTNTYPIISSSKERLIIGLPYSVYNPIIIN